MTKKTAILILNWNSYECTRDAIHSVKAMPYHDYDIILIDNNSADGSGQRLSDENPGIIFLSLNENRGFAGGNNAGINYSLNRDYSFTLLLNNDTFVEPDFLEILVRELDNDPSIGAVQPKIYFNHDRSLLWNGGSWFNPWTGNDYVEGTGKKRTSGSEIEKEPHWLTGCAMLIRNSAIKKTGLLDESLFMYYEDVDYSFRIRNQGFKLKYHPGSVVYHIAGASTRAREKGKEGFLNPIVHYYLIRNRIWFLKKYLKPWHWPTAGLLVGTYLAGTLAYFAVRQRFLKLKTAWKAIKDGFSGSISDACQFDESI